MMGNGTVMVLRVDLYSSSSFSENTSDFHQSFLLCFCLFVFSPYIFFASLLLLFQRRILAFPVLVKMEEAASSTQTKTPVTAVAASQDIAGTDVKVMIWGPY